MKIFVDANVIIDYLVDRDPFAVVIGNIMEVRWFRYSRRLFP